MMLCEPGHDVEKPKVNTLAKLETVLPRGSGEMGRRCTQTARTSIVMPHTRLPNLSQNLLPFIWTNTNMKDKADISLMAPKRPVKNSEDETEVKPADMKILGASMIICQVIALLPQASKITYSSLGRLGRPCSEPPSSQYLEPDACVRFYF